MKLFIQFLLHVLVNISTPGRMIRHWPRFHNITSKAAIGRNDALQPGDRQGILETAPVTIKVKDTGCRPLISEPK